jgi:hypothetical protein
MFEENTPVCGAHGGTINLFVTRKDNYRMTRIVWKIAGLE